jgi:hypothetical protein
MTPFLNAQWPQWKRYPSKCLPSGNLISFFAGLLSRTLDENKIEIRANALTIACIANSLLTVLR